MGSEQAARGQAAETSSEGRKEVLTARGMRQGEVVMPSDDGRTSEAYKIERRGVIHVGVRPRKIAPKPWPSDKPPGGKLPSKAPKADEES